MMCAATAGQRGRRVLLIEHYHKLGEKIRISGGGRCNFTNTGAGPANYLSRKSGLLPLGARALHAARLHRAGRAPRHRVSREEARPALLRRSVDADHRHAARGMRRGRRRVVACPVPVDGGVARRRNVSSSPRRTGSPTRRSLVIATGGLTVPKIGATPFGVPHRRTVRVARRAAAARARAARVRAGCPRALRRSGGRVGRCRDRVAAAARFRENLLFTHRGLSGPAILQISSYWDGRSPLSIDLLPDVDAVAWLADQRAFERAPRHAARGASCRAASRSSGATAHDATRPLREFTDRRTRRDRSAICTRWRVLPSGTLGYNKAEVTRGRRRHARAVVEDDGGARRSRPALHRRGRRRDGLARRLQFPVGVGVGPRGGIGGVANPFRDRRGLDPRRCSMHCRGDIMLSSVGHNPNEGVFPMLGFLKRQTETRGSARSVCSACSPRSATGSCGSSTACCTTGNTSRTRSSSTVEKRARRSTSS